MKRVTSVAFVLILGFIVTMAAACGSTSTSPTTISSIAVTGAATVSSSGVVTGVAEGSTTVQATYLSISGTDAITIPAQ